MNGGRRRAARQSFGLSAVLVALILAVFVISHAVTASTTAYSVLDEVPLDELTLAVDSWTDLTGETPPSRAPGDREATGPPARQILVSLRSWGVPANGASVGQFLAANLSLTNADGLRFPVATVLGDDATQGRPAPRPGPEGTWSVVFQVRGLSEGYALQVRSPDGQTGDSRTVIVRLQPKQSHRPLLAGQASGAHPPD